MKWKNSKVMEEPKKKRKQKPKWLEGNMYDTEEDWYDACYRDYYNEQEGNEDEYYDLWDIKG